MKSTWLIPVAIVFVGVILAITTYNVSRHTNVTKDGDPSAMRPVTSSDHLLGNPVAPVLLVEYADIDSAYAKDFQNTMVQVMKDYGDEGNVAWVFRHFPLIGQDPYSEQHAEAAECASAQTPNSSRMFFDFITALQAATPGQGQFNPSDYPALVASLGLSEKDFELCLQNKTYQKHIAEDYQNGMDIGASGSPFSILLVKGQKPVVISGSLPYATVKKILDKSISAVLNSGG